MSTIVIDRVPLNLLGLTTEARAELLARRVREAVQRSLPVQLAAACERMLRDDDSYVFIERLDVQCAIAADWPDDAVGREFAQCLARTLLRERHAGDAVVFRDRAELIAAFIPALIDGHAFSRWWFAEFDGLRPLPVSTALRTLVANEPPVAWQALARLTPELLRRLVGVLSPADVYRIVVTAPRADGDQLATGAAVVQAFDAARGVSNSSSVRLLTALLGLESCTPGMANARNLVVLRVLNTLVEAARSGALPAYPSVDPATTLRRWCADLAVESGVADLPDSDAAILVDYVLAAAPETAGAGVETATVNHTSHGGAVLLCALLARLGWWTRWRETLQRAGAVRSDSVAAWTALAVVSRVLNPRRPVPIADDQCLRTLFGVAEPPGAIERSARRAACHALATDAPRAGVVAPRRLEPLLRAFARALLREFAARVPGCHESTSHYLRTQCLTLGAAVSADGSRATVGRAPLDVLLVLSGLTRADVSRPDGTRLVISRDTFP